MTPALDTVKSIKCRDITESYCALHFFYFHRIFLLAVVLFRRWSLKWTYHRWWVFCGMCPYLYR